MPNHIGNRLSSEELIDLFYELGFVIVNATATDGEWILIHSSKLPVRGNGKIYIPRDRITNNMLVSHVIQQAQDMYDISINEIVSKGQLLFPDLM